MGPTSTVTWEAALKPRGERSGPKNAQRAREPLRSAGIPAGIKDNICTKVKPPALQNTGKLCPPYDATVMERLQTKAW